MKSTFVRRALGCLVLGVVALPVGCSSGEPEELGTLELSLRSTGSQGTLYGLRGRFVLNDPDQLTVNVGELDTTATATLQPRVGTYGLELCGPMSANTRCVMAPAYALFKLQCADMVTPAAQCVPPLQLVATPVTGAVLNSPNPQNVSILANQSTTATFSFTVPGDGNIVFARGTLDIGVDVTEGFAVGQPCAQAVECQSKVCAGGVCAAASCMDGVQNGSETGPDCGGSCPQACAALCNPPCPANAVCQNGMCVSSSTCNPPCSASQVCQNGVCVNPSTCMDGQQNGGETGVDCGGPCPNTCPAMCSPACGVNQTCLNGACVPSTCANGMQNLGEAGIDCGGMLCPPCAAGVMCVPNSSCGLNRPCTGGVCP